MESFLLGSTLAGNFNSGSDIPNFTNPAVQQWNVTYSSSGYTSWKSYFDLTATNGKTVWLLSSKLSWGATTITGSAIGTTNTSAGAFHFPSITLPASGDTPLGEFTVTTSNSKDGYTPRSATYVLTMRRTNSRYQFGIINASGILQDIGSWFSDKAWNAYIVYET